MWRIEINADQRTLTDTKRQFIRTTGILDNRFKTDKAQLWYKEFFRTHRTFYIYYLKVGGGGGLWEALFGGFYIPIIWGSRISSHVQIELQNRQVTNLRYMYRDSWDTTFTSLKKIKKINEGLFKRLLHKFGVYQTFVEPHYPWQNQADPSMGKVKQHAQKIMLHTNTTMLLWYFCYY